MHDPSRTNRELLEENSALKKRIQELEKSEVKRKMAEEAVRESENKYRLLFDSAGDAIFIHGEEGQIQAFNPRATERYGYTHEELMSMKANQVDSPDEGQHVAKRIAILMERGQYKFETVHQCKDGSLIPTEVSARRIAWDAEPAIMSICRDISNRKRVEDALLNEEREKAAILDAMSEIVIYLDTDMRIVWSNRATNQHFNVTPEQVKGRHCYEALHKLNRHCKICPVVKAFETGEPHIIDDHSSYGKRWMLCAYPVRNENGEVIGVVEIVTDISARKEEEEYLKQSEKKFATAFLKNSVPAAITTVKEGKYIEVSEAFLKLMGMERNEIIGNTSTGIGFITPEQRQIVLNEFSQNGFVENLELQIRTKGGGRRYGLFNSVMISIAGENHLLTLVTDITEFKRAEENIRILAHLSDISPLSITVHDLDGKFLYANKRTFDLHGYTKDEFFARNLHEIDTPSSVAQGDAHIKEILETGEAAFEVEHYRKDGTCFPLEVFVKATEWGGTKVLLSVASDITNRKQVEEELARYRGKLEQLVAERTRDLEDKTKALEEVNIALKVLLQHREEDRKELEDRFVMNIKNLIIPFAEKIKNTRLDERQLAYLSIIESHLNDITSSMIKKMHQFNFTPTEIEIASLIREGKATKEIAKIMGIATSSIDTHRNNIRKKLGISKENVNLRSRLEHLD